MSSKLTRNAGPTHLATVELDGGLVEPAAIVAGLLAAGHRAVQLLAAGNLVWENEPDLAIAPGAAAHAERMALLWQRTARHLQCRKRRPRRSHPHRPVDPARSSETEFRTDP
jgi:hypothetical protein